MKRKNRLPMLIFSKRNPRRVNTWQNRTSYSRQTVKPVYTNLLRALCVPTHSDQTWLGVLKNGLNVLGFHRCPNTHVGITLQSLPDKKRLYEQSAFLRRIGKPLVLWLGLVGLGNLLTTPVALAGDEVKKYGHVADLGENSSHGANYLLGSKITVTQDIVLTHVGIIFRTTNYNAQVGVYSDVAGNPDTLLADTGTFAVTAIGPVETPVQSQVSLPAGNYWFMAVYSSTASTGKSDLGDSYKYTAHSFGMPLPSPFGPTSDGKNSFNYYLVGRVDSDNDGEYVLETPPNSQFTTVPVNMEKLIAYCADESGCQITLSIKDDPGSVNGPHRFFYSDTTKQWNVSSLPNPATGQDKNSVTEHILQAGNYACYFTDGEYVINQNPTDDQAQLGLLKWSGAGPTQTCVLTIDD